MISIWWNFEMNFFENSIIRQIQWNFDLNLGVFLRFFVVSQKKKHILGSFETHLCVFNSFMCMRPGIDFFQIKKNTDLDYLFASVKKLWSARLSQIKNEHFFQKLTKSREIVQNWREKIPGNVWTSFFPKLIELSSYHNYRTAKLEKWI